MNTVNIINQTKRVSKKIGRELIPNVFIRIYRLLRKPQQNQKPLKEDITKLYQQLKINSTQESLIIGNGPSVNELLTKAPEFIKGKTIFCVNSFADSTYYEEVKPSFYIFADPVYWNKNCSTKLTDLVTKISQQLVTKTTWPITLLLPTYAQEWNWFQTLSQENSHISLAYYNLSTCDTGRNDKFNLYKQNFAMPQAQTVLVSAIFISINLGFKTNYVIGGDMSLHEGIYVDKNNVVCYSDRHFYDKHEPESAPFWKNAEHTETWKMDEIFTAISLMFRGFREIEEYAQAIDTKVYNLSPKSYIDAFERYEIGDDQLNETDNA